MYCHVGIRVYYDHTYSTCGQYDFSTCMHVLRWTFNTYNNSYLYHIHLLVLQLASVAKGFIMSNCLSIVNCISPTQNSSMLRNPWNPQEQPTRTRARCGTRGTFKSDQPKVKHAEEHEEPSRTTTQHSKHVEELEEPSRATNQNSSKLRNSRNPQERPSRTQAR